MYINYFRPFKKTFQKDVTLLFPVELLHENADGSKSSHYKILRTRVTYEFPVVSTYIMLCIPEFLAIDVVLCMTCSV